MEVRVINTVTDQNFCANALGAWAIKFRAESARSISYSTDL